MRRRLTGMDVLPEEPAGHAHSGDGYETGPLQRSYQSYQEAHYGLSLIGRETLQVFLTGSAQCDSVVASFSPSGVSRRVTTRRSSGHCSRWINFLVSSDATASLTVAWVRSNSLASWLTRLSSTSW